MKRRQVAEELRIVIYSAVIIMCLALAAHTVLAEQVFAAERFPADYGTLAKSYEDKTVILSSNDVHGAIDGYQYIAGLRDELQRRGADVYLVDSGDFCQGSVNVAWDRGASATKMMNAAGYSFAAIGNHEFDHGFEALMNSRDNADFKMICGNVFDRDTGQTLLDSTGVIENGELLIGFIGLDTPETRDKALPSAVKGLTFLDNETDPTIYDKAKSDVKALRDQGADIVIALTHLGCEDVSAPYRSVDMWDAIGGEADSMDLILDGHSHTVMTSGEHGEPIMSTGTGFQNVGVTVIDEKEEKIEERFLYKVEYIRAAGWSGDEVKAESDSILAEVEKVYSEKIGRSEVDLNGEKDAESIKDKGLTFDNGNRDGETNFGDLIADAFIAAALRNGETYDVEEDHIVGIMNGSAIRQSISAGDVTRMDVVNGCPYANSVCGVYIQGSELLEVLEVSTHSLPASDNGFPQVSGIEFSVDISKEYSPNGEPYPGSGWHGPKEIRRVTIASVNGRPFSPDDTYLVMTTNFNADGGDGYYRLSQAEKQFDTGVMVADSIISYISDELGGVIGDRYMDPAGRIRIVTEPEMLDNPMEIKAANKTVSYKKVKKSAVTVKPIKVTKAKGTVTYEKVSGSSRFRVDKKTGAVRIKKGTKKKTYTIRVRVTASGNAEYKPKTKNVTVKIKIK